MSSPDDVTNNISKYIANKTIFQNIKQANDLVSALKFIELEPSDAIFIADDVRNHFDMSDRLDIIKNCRVKFDPNDKDYYNQIHDLTYTICNTLELSPLTNTLEAFNDLNSKIKMLEIHNSILRSRVNQLERSTKSNIPSHGTITQYDLEEAINRKKKVNQTQAHKR